jgi:glycosyltransferase involved in cell wall biosynthesis
MRIAVIAPVWIPVPPDGYGGIERMLKLLVDELVSMGHDVTLYGAGDCRTLARQRITMERAPTEHMGETLYDAYHVGQAFREVREGGFDIVHDHAGFLGPAFASLLEVPLVHTLHGPFLPETIMFYSAFAKDCYYVAISEHQRRCFPHLNYVGVVHNAVDTEEHRYEGVKEDYLVHVSRICEAKGTVEAIRLARQKGWKLYLAGKIDPGRDREYFEREVRPLLDGKNVIYLGEISQEDKVKLISRARAFLFPIRWQEPFGLVMTEALACGTPVLATRWGAVPEVVEHGRTGFVADTPEELATYLDRIDEIEPWECRRVAEERFSPRAMASGYLEVYEKVLAMEKEESAAQEASIST